MNSFDLPDANIQELGGEPLDGSGFESETPSEAFEPVEQLAEEGSVQ